MEALLSVPLVMVFAAGLGVSLLFIFGARYVAYRVAGHQESVSTNVVDVFPSLPRRRISLRRAAIRLALLTVVGAGLGVILLRFIYGLGSVTNLSDQFTWGLWIGFDVMSGVALAAGAFVIAATVHIFRIHRFEPLVRPAILTGLLGYLLVVAGLVVDLGRPYNVWQPLVHWQYHSVLWEVGVCVATYTAVLMIEFLPVVLERLNEYRAITSRLPTETLYRLLKRVSIVFVILGVVLSTLHQSSLGSLWVLMPTKVHPLWYSIYLPVFFWMSAVAVGLAMTIVESTLSSKALGRGLETHLLADLAKVASIVLGIYLVARAVDLVVRGAWSMALQPSLQAGFFWLEMGVGIILPAILFAIRPWRYRPWVLFTGALLVVVFGIVLNRLNVSIVSLLPYTGAIYTPAWTEVLVTVTLVTLGVIAFALAAKYLPLFPEEEHAGLTHGQA